ncbi:MAG TPA: hypothetical protein PK626_01435, partial [Bacteroidales bacterium]|nr:hypothetical protein [Bacteroidales bacterium]
MIYSNKYLFLSLFLIFFSLSAYSQVNVNINPSEDTIVICAESFLDLSAEVDGGSTPYTYLWYGADSLLSNLDSSYTIFNSFTSGTFMIYCEVIDNYGNSDTDSVIIKVNPLPPLIVSPQLDSLCIGDSITLSASGA